MSDEPIFTQDEMAGAIKVVLDHGEAELSRLRSEVERLREALQELYVDNLDYIQINNLSGAENNFAMRVARKVLDDTIPKETSK